ncbi:MAG: hypothetical protein KDK33_09780, partial [Leptospiraceae bacterium]|nr:hypothetical protein [Leptospiraceae bacterium]
HDEIVAIRDTIVPGSRIDPAQLPDEDYITELKSKREKSRIESDKDHAGWITYTGMVISFCIFFWMLFRIVRLQLRLAKDVADPKERHDLMDDAILDFSAAGLFLPLGIVALEWAYASSFWSVLLIPVGVIGSWLLHDLALKSVRNVSRKCSECGKTMQKLGEAEDDAYLDAGQRAEEALGSVDYDVWICECGASQIVRFKEVSSQQKCPSCQYRTYTVAKTKIIQKPTTESAGKGERTMQCSYCGFEAKSKYSIPKTEASGSDQKAAAGMGAAAALHAALDSSLALEEKPSSESFSHDDSQYEPSNSSDSNDSSSSDWDIPDDFGGGESGGGGASSDY